MKRKYKQPLIEQYTIDREIALVLMSPDTGESNLPPGGGDPPGVTSEETSAFKESSLDENNFK